MRTGEHGDWATCCAYDPASTDWRPRAEGSEASGGLKSLKSGSRAAQNGMRWLGVVTWSSWSLQWKLLTALAAHGADSTPLNGG